ncbi:MULTISPECIES: hypothetical protein [Moorena]|uniref:Uncharacterized protein n=1 Tax=Moorena producens (strain JHB) TaxID=1454205 RepID=A0A9Q9SSB9_MOOP1|nr:MULTISPECIES: hypothetical protein [Moorena]NEQ13701.1 hypothetical protein [Moorena sp. SIO3E2]NEP33498.1 hypothetical protein [Moorena sp. SIO3B2]NEP64845.1 hypothetical protein [Moorena sp. SIO3A5]NEQ09086.1 hypothetical protein [Moorena sp. SIO4E2]NER87492.1 hypothetical protein [Moorena sp. SIO3A2]
MPTNPMGSFVNLPDPLPTLHLTNYISVRWAVPSHLMGNLVNLPNPLPTLHLHQLELRSH